MSKTKQKSIAKQKELIKPEDIELVDVDIRGFQELVDLGIFKTFEDVVQAMKSGLAEVYNSRLKKPKTA